MHFILYKSQLDDSIETSSDKVKFPPTYGVMLQAHHPHDQQPLTKLKLLLHKYDRPIKIIALIDTRVVSSILKPSVIPQSYWEPHKQYFRAAKNKIFVTEAISKTMTIQPFPSINISHKFLASNLHVKDAIIRFDLI